MRPCEAGSDPFREAGETERVEAARARLVLPMQRCRQRSMTGSPERSEDVDRHREFETLQFKRVRRLELGEHDDEVPCKQRRVGEREKRIKRE